MKLVVLSPHLDDAALSIGAWIASAVSRGRDVLVLTVLANDPGSRLQASPWENRCGFSSAREAARTRRLEDERAMRVLGAQYEWLPLGDKEHDPPSTDAILDAVSPYLRGADLLVCPGYPLLHPDHVLVAEAAAQIADIPVAYYVEQPYANTKLMGRAGYGGPSRSIPSGVGALFVHAGSPVTSRHRATPAIAPSGERFRSINPTPSAHFRKYRAISQYASQLRAMGPFVRLRILLYEFGARGEGLAGVTGLADASPGAADAGASRRRSLS